MRGAATATPLATSQGLTSGNPEGLQLRPALPVLQIVPIVRVHRPFIARPSRRKSTVQRAQEWIERASHVTGSIGMRHEAQRQLADELGWPRQCVVVHRKRQSMRGGSLGAMRGTAHPRPGRDGLGSSRTSLCRSTARCSHKASLAWYRTVKTLIAAAHLRSPGFCRAAGRRTSLAGAQRKILGEIQAIHLAVAMAVADDPSSRGSLHPCPASALSTKVESRRSFARPCEMRIQFEAATKPLSAVSNAGQLRVTPRPTVLPRCSVGATPSVQHNQAGRATEQSRRRCTIVTPPSSPPPASLAWRVGQNPTEVARGRAGFGGSAKRSALCHHRRPFEPHSPFRRPRKRSPHRPAAPRASTLSDSALPPPHSSNSS
ncbi:hypothetical protein L1887_51322 [Cichorium endivia]|nr:hypothetical protein L1887_51322 [Cichorium endivia]